MYPEILNAWEKFLDICIEQTHLLWVEDSDDLCDVSLVESWDDITAWGEELQLECLIGRERRNHQLKSNDTQREMWTLQKENQAKIHAITTYFHREDDQGFYNHSLLNSKIFP